MPHARSQVSFLLRKALSLKYIDIATENTSVHPLLHVYGFLWGLRHHRSTQTIFHLLCEILQLKKECLIMFTLTMKGRSKLKPGVLKSYSWVGDLAQW